MNTSTMPLSPEAQEKVSIINDINKDTRLLTGHGLEPSDFNYLYDMEIEKLREHAKQLQLNTAATMHDRARSINKPFGDLL